jgi:integrase
MLTPRWCGSRTARLGSRHARSSGDWRRSPVYEYLIVRGDCAITRNPVPRGLAMRRPGQRAVRGVPLIRAPRTLPRVIDPDEIDALMGALRRHRDRAMVEAMLLGGLRRCEVLGLRLEDLHPGERRVFIAEGKGGHRRILPVSNRFFPSVAEYLAGTAAKVIDRPGLRGPEGMHGHGRHLRRKV